MSFIICRCSVDPDTTIISQGSHETRFMFNAFEFPMNHDSVYVTCSADFCQAADITSRCRQTCTHARSLETDQTSIVREQNHIQKQIFVHYRIQ